MTEAARREDAFRSALERLPMAVIVVDGQRNLQPYNQRAGDLFESEALLGDLLSSRPAHPLSALVREVLASTDDPAERVLTFPSGRRFRVEPSRRSEKGTGRWLMLLVTPVADDDAREDYGFTPREQEVVDRLLAGATTTDICAALSIGRDTLKSHMRRLFEKTDTRSRAALVAKLLKPR